MRGLGLCCALVMGGCSGELGLSLAPEDMVTSNVPDLCTPTKTDRIYQVDSAKVDVLWVIDNSGSMMEEQQLVRDNLSAFMQYFQDSALDWHIGAITIPDTSRPEDDGLLLSANGYNFVSAETPNAEEVFANIVAASSVRNSPIESGRQAIAGFLEKIEGRNSGFYREDSTFHIIVVTDDTDLSGSNPSLNEFAAMLTSLKNEPEMVRFTAIAGDLPNGCTGPHGTAFAGAGYHALIGLVDGLFESICEEDWVPLLERLGVRASSLRVEYYLSEIPVPGSIELTLEIPQEDGEPFVYHGVDSLLLEDGSSVEDHCAFPRCFLFSYSATRNSVYIEDLTPPVGSVVEADYELLREWQPDGCDEETVLPE